MTEQDYMVATALAKVRIATDALRDVDIGNAAFIPPQEHAATMAALVRWRLALEAYVLAPTPTDPTP